jgi:hypothetical protein
MIIIPTGFGTKNVYADEDQQQFTLPTDKDKSENLQYSQSTEIVNCGQKSRGTPEPRMTVLVSLPAEIYATDLKRGYHIKT